jgi:UDP-2,3-diacylglucosamine hydrolase
LSGLNRNTVNPFLKTIPILLTPLISQGYGSPKGDVLTLPVSLTIVSRMKDVFIADAHLIDPADNNYRKLLTFLEEQRGKVRTLFLLGDIFEFWVGYRHAVFASYVPMLEALRQLREDGTEIVYVEGNHDFHMGPYFKETLGCRILTEGGAFEIDGRKIFIAHGDLANPDDKGYRRLRRILRSRPLRWIINIVPPDQAWIVARWASRQSQKGKVAKNKRWAPREILIKHARKCFAEGYDAVVTGHFHVPLFRETNEGTLVALGDWITQYSYAILEDGTFFLKSF